jgi:hypothetical protein
MAHALAPTLSVPQLESGDHGACAGADAERASAREWRLPATRASPTSDEGGDYLGCAEPLDKLRYGDDHADQHEHDNCALQPDPGW